MGWRGAALGQTQVGLYDQLGMLRFAGAAEDDCLAYAALFALAEDSFSLVPLAPAPAGSPADCSS